MSVSNQKNVRQINFINQGYFKINKNLKQSKLLTLSLPSLCAIFIIIVIQHASRSLLLDYAYRIGHHLV